MNINKTTLHNTDNKGHLYCHIFCNLHLHPRKIYNADTATAPLPSIKFRVPRLITCTPVTLYRDTCKTQPIMYPDCKKCAMLRSFRLVPGLYPNSDSLLQPAFTQQHKRPLLPGRYGASLP